MKKNIFFVILFLIIVVSVILVNYFDNVKTKREIIRENSEYTQYEKANIKINDLITLMNKAIDTNRKNNIETDEKGEFLENDTNSIKVYLEIESRGSVIPMEALLLSDVSTIDKVEKLFSDMFFKCNQIEYHEKTGRIKKIVFKAIE